MVGRTEKRGSLQGEKSVLGKRNSCQGDLSGVLCGNYLLTLFTPLYDEVGASGVLPNGKFGI